MLISMPNYLHSTHDRKIILVMFAVLNYTGWLSPSYNLGSFFHIDYKVNVIDEIVFSQWYVWSGI